MPRSNSSFGVADGGNVVSPAPRRCGGGAPADRAAGISKIERLAGVASAGRADRRFGRDRQLTTAERARRAGRIRILVGIEGIATAPARRRRHACRLLDDRRRGRDLLAIARLGRWLPVGRAGLRRSALWRCWAGRRGGRRGRPARRPEAPQALLELPVAILQFLILAGELPQLILELLNAHLRIVVIGLRQRECLANDKRQHRGHRRGAGNSMKSG